jgi:hypothetical protein
MQFKKTILGAAVATSLGIAAVPVAHADMITGTWTGIFTMLDPTGAALTNSGNIGSCYSAAEDTDTVPGNYTGGCTRTGTVTGTMTFDTATFSGSASITPFSFFGSGKASATGATFVAVGDGKGGPGTLVLGNMGFDWNGTFGIPVSLVFDGAGFFGAVGAGLTVGEVLSGGATPASANGDGAFDGGALLATTVINTSTVAGAGLGSNPSGTLPLSGFASTIGGDPMIAGPFPGFNANFDFMSVTVTGCTDTDNTGFACAPAPVVPVPAAVWLFGSGLLGLVGVARRRKSK